MWLRTSLSRVWTRGVNITAGASSHHVPCSGRSFYRDFCFVKGFSFRSLRVRRRCPPHTSVPTQGTPGAQTITASVAAFMHCDTMGAFSCFGGGGSGGDGGVYAATEVASLQARIAALEADLKAATTAVSTSLSNSAVVKEAEAAMRVRQAAWYDCDDMTCA